MNFKGLHILITGGARGIGKATAIEFAKRGAIVGINYKSDDANALATKQLLSGTQHHLFKYDISIKEQQKELIDQFIHTYGTIDVLVNNAGISIPHALE